MTEHELYNEKELLRKMSEGDEKAFNAVYHHYAPRIYGKLLKVLHSEDLASEILQDVFTTIWRKHASIDAEKSFRSYLFKIADNMVIDLFRKTRLNKEVMNKILAASVDYYTHTEEWMQQKENLTTLNSILNVLPPQQKLVFTLCKLENKSHEEVGKLLNISPSTVNNHMVKATQALRTYLLAHPDIMGIFLIGFLFY